MRNLGTPAVITSRGMSIVKMSPELATHLLEKNDDNRPISMQHVKMLAGAMKRGEWKLTHQPIAIAPSGRLLDGQHRLWAVVESGVTIDCVVIRDVPEDTFDCIDIGKRRSISDVLGGDKAMIGVSTAMARYVHGHSQVTPQIVEGFVKYFGPAIEELLAHAPSSAKGLTNAQVRLAAVLRMTNPQNKEYVKQQYRALSVRDYGAMQPIVQSFVRQVDSNTRKIIEWEIGARAYFAFDVRAKNTERLIMKNHMIHVEEMREVIRTVMGKKK